MNSAPKALRASLLKRELELHRLIRQMKIDELHKSTVFKNLEQELNMLKKQITALEEALY
jgi:hypothetical protein